MQFDVCIPVYRNLRCLEVAIMGWRKHIVDSKRIRKFLIHIEDKEEMEGALRIFSSYSFDVEVASVGNGQVNMVHPMNALFAACKAPWVLFGEQDLFLCSHPDELVSDVIQCGFDVAGPVDTFFYDNINSREMPHYGQYGRLSGEPGHYHSSLIVMNREVVESRSRVPFLLPDGYLMHGTGCLGGELYYGLRVNMGDERSKLGFFRQHHGDYGYAAVITHRNKPIATHLYYSSRQTICQEPGSSLKSKEAMWLEREEQRFLDDYGKYIRSMP